MNALAPELSPKTLEQIEDIRRFATKQVDDLPEDPSLNVCLACE